MQGVSRQKKGKAAIRGALRVIYGGPTVPPMGQPQPVAAPVFILPEVSLKTSLVWSTQNVLVPDLPGETGVAVMEKVALGWSRVGAGLGAT